MKPCEIRDSLSSLGMPCGDFEVLQHDPGRVTLRTVSGGKPVVVKLLAYSCLTGVSYLCRGNNPLKREWTILNDLYGSSIAVPRPLEFRSLHRRGAWFSFRDALAMEYLEGSLTAGKQARSLLDSGRIEELSRLEDEMVVLTKHLLDAGYYDIDHSPHNMLQNGSSLYRFDFGLARKAIGSWQPIYGHGEMLGHLIAMYTFALQPDVARIPLFAGKLLNTLSPPAAVWHQARQSFVYRMEKQKRETEIDTVVELPQYT
jgi:hypothetical protein